MIKSRQGEIDGSADSPCISSLGIAAFRDAVLSRIGGRRAGVSHDRGGTAVYGSESRNRLFDLHQRPALRTPRPPQQRRQAELATGEEYRSWSGWAHMDDH